MLAPVALLTLSSERVRFFVMDVSFISATLVLPAVLGALAPAGERMGHPVLTGRSRRKRGGRRSLLARPAFFHC
ncbi:MAG: hypothetical protein ABI147_10130 [Acidobacteriaceae bacterium]